MLPCSLCGLLFRNEDAITEHIATNHSGDDYDSPEHWESDQRKAVREKFRSAYGYDDE